MVLTHSRWESVLDKKTLKNKEVKAAHTSYVSIPIWNATLVKEGLTRKQWTDLHEFYVGFFNKEGSTQSWIAQREFFPKFAKELEELYDAEPPEGTGEAEEEVAP